jgi:hypothetical protein
MLRSFIVQINPLSINSRTYANVRHGLKPKAKEWEAQVFHQLDNKKDLSNFKDLRKHFDEELHYYRVDFIYLIPYKKLITSTTKKRTLKTPDLTNIEKPLADLLFLPQHFGETHPYGLENLNIDDKTIGELHSTKRASPDDKYYIKIFIEIKDLDLIKSTESLSSLGQL